MNLAARATEIGNGIMTRIARHFVFHHPASYLIGNETEEA